MLSFYAFFHSVSSFSICLDLAFYKFSQAKFLASIVSCGAQIVSVHLAVSAPSCLHSSPALFQSFYELSCTVLEKAQITQNASATISH